MKRMKAVDVLMRSWSWSLRQLLKTKIRRRSRQREAPHCDRSQIAVRATAIMPCINAMGNLENLKMTALYKLVDIG